MFFCEQFNKTILGSKPNSCKSCKAGNLTRIIGFIPFNGNTCTCYCPSPCLTDFSCFLPAPKTMTWISSQAQQIDGPPLKWTRHSKLAYGRSGIFIFRFLARTRTEKTSESWLKDKLSYLIKEMKLHVAVDFISSLSEQEQQRLWGNMQFFHFLYECQRALVTLKRLCWRLGVHVFLCHIYILSSVYITCDLTGDVKALQVKEP